MKYFATAIASLPLLLAACNSVNTIDDPDPDPGQSGSKLRRMAVEVLDYSPAPGQFINTLPEYADGDTPATMLRKTTEALNTGHEVSLGAWGGSITIRLSEPIENDKGGDFAVLGNAIIAGTDASGRSYGSCEPGIVEVMHDDNGNGLPDDTWFELRGEAHDASTALFTATYHAPTDDADNNHYIKWTASDGSEGWINRVVSHHTQPFFPQWQKATELTFTARRLPDNGVYNDKTMRYDLYILSGYADAWPDSDERCLLDLDDAVDSDGHSVSLRRVHFVRVTTGVLQCNGPLGEISTEVSGIAVPAASAM